MNREQKIAWFNLIVMPVSLVIILISGFLQLPYLVGAIELAGVFALIFASPVFFRKKPGRVSFDERDAIINKRANLISSFAAFGGIGGQILLKLMSTGLQGSVRMYEVILIYISGLICLIVAKSVTILIQYSRGQKGEKNYE